MWWRIGSSSRGCGRSRRTSAEPGRRRRRAGTPRARRGPGHTRACASRRCRSRLRGGFAGRRRRRVGRGGCIGRCLVEPPPLPEPPVHRLPARRAGATSGLALAQAADDRRRPLAGGERLLGLPAQLRPRVGPREIAGGHRSGQPRLMDRDRPGSPGGEAPRRAPDVGQARREVTPRPPREELPRPVPGAQPHADAARQVHLRAGPRPGSTADRTRRKAPEGLPLVEALEHRPTMTPEVARGGSRA